MAGAFLMIAILEMGSHAYMNSQLPTGLEGIPLCQVAPDRPTTVDCPVQQKHRGSEINLDETLIHAMILNKMTVRTGGIVYRSSVIVRSIVHPLSGVSNPPFHPPKLV